MYGRERGIRTIFIPVFCDAFRKKIRPKAVVNNDWHAGRLIVLVISAGKLAFKMQLEIHLGDWWAMWLINLSRFRGGPALHHPLWLSSWAARLVKSSVSEANSSEWLPFRWNGYQDPLFNVKTRKNIVFPFWFLKQLSRLLLLYSPTKHYSPLCSTNSWYWYLYNR